MAGHDRAITRLGHEITQAPELRKDLYRFIEGQLGSDHRVVSLFTSFKYPVILEDGDADMLEEVLLNTDLDGKTLALVLNCPGGDGLAAERIVNLCRAASDNRFIVIVPKMAKSAATMVCLGANQILMSPTSELGPIDPQILIRGSGGMPDTYQAAHEIIESYDDLIRQANTTKGRIEPFLQQLNRYDARDIQRIKSAQKLSESIAVNMLKSGMLKSLSERRIRTKIEELTDPNKTINHGRPVFHDTAVQCGLNVALHQCKSKLWRAVWELYVRLNFLTNSSSPKIIESADYTWAVGD